MRLLYTIPDFWPHVRRGSERLVHDLSAEMARRGHTVTVITRSPSGRAEEVEADGVRVRYLPTPERLLRRFRYTPMESFAVTAAMAALREPADVLHGFFLTDTYGLALTGWLHRLPLVMSIHGPPQRHYWSASAPRSYAWTMRSLARVRRVVVISEDSAERMLREFGFAPTVLIPGIRTADYALPRRPPIDPVVVCAAAIDDGRKRLDVLLNAFEEIAGDDRGVRLLLVGHGSTDWLRARLLSMEAHVRDRVEHRPVGSDELPAVYAEATVGALTSEMEAFGLVVVEYLAAGLPVVGTAHGGIPEIVTPEVGRLFRPGDPHDCATQLRAVLDIARDPGAADRCRARARAFDLSVRADAYEEMYRELAA